MALSAGERIGPYEILAAIGAGGMGEVYRARDPRMGRNVAIKIAAVRFSERFSREVHAVAALNHPNICHIYDVGPNFLVLELVEGQTLADRIKQGPVPLEEALGIARQIAGALEAAHERGIVHRDLKPANVKLTPEGVVKVLDFGLAKIAEPAESGGLTENSPTLTLDAATRAGTIMGTAGYMSPEQARGKTVDKRADIWAFGVVLYELLAGKRLFQGSDVSEILAAVIKEEPNLERVPARVRRLLAKCLAKDPKQRLRDIGDAWDLLDDATPPQQSTAKGGMAGWIAAGVLLIVLGAVSWLHFREPATEGPVRLQLSEPDGGVTAELALSPDGRMLATATTVNGKRQLWLRALDSPQAQAIPGTDDATYPFWSPDSRYVGFFAEDKLKKVIASGGPPQTLCDAPEGRAGSWNRGGIILFSAVDGGGFAIRRVSSSGGSPELAAKAPKGLARYPLFLPDGNHFLYVVTRASPEENGMYFRSLDGKENRRILPDESSAVFAGGRVLFIRDHTLLAQSFDPRRGQLLGDPAPVATGVSVTSNVVYAPVSASDTGTLIYQLTPSSSGRNQMIWYDRGGKQLGTLGVPGYEPVISPDEKFVLFMRLSPSGSDLWTWDVSRNAAQMVHKDPAFAEVPIWSPRGDYFVFASNRVAGTPNFFRRAFGGAGQEEAVFASETRKTLNQWSRDGRFLVYSQTDPKSREDLWVLPVENGKAGKPAAFLNSEFNELQGQLSPDGRWMAYTSDESGRREVYIRAFPSGAEPKKISINGGEGPRWRGDGKELYFVAPDGKVTAVSLKVEAGARQSLQPGPAEPLFEAPPLAHYFANSIAYDVTADGKRFLLDVTVPGAASSAPLQVALNWPAGLRK